MTETVEGTTAPKLEFIRDVAADTDSFGSHDRVAKAIASVIATNEDLKVIGLLGRWGSGKSTVVGFVQKHLNADPDIDTHTFCYDAWLHQSDPPRRSFLETFIEFLIDRDLTTQERWQEQLDILNRQIEDTETKSTPSLTVSGHLLLLSLVLVPLGMHFIGHDWFDAAFDSTSEGFESWAFWLGPLLLTVPPVVALGIWLSWRTTLWPFNRMFWAKANWAKHRPPHHNDSLLSLFVNKEVTKELNRTIRTPDPTTIEFQRLFREIIDEVSSKKSRLILVIDNLDRLHEAEAVSMWGTIRSFFLGREHVNRASRATHLPTVLLPIDQEAIERMYAVEHGKAAPALAQSFMEKTFDLTFHVTRPVLSDWSTYLTDQLQKVFGTELKEEWAFQVGRLYEKAHDKDEITPRAINVAINSIATLWLQWREEGVSFIAIAYYVIFRDRIGREISGAVHNPIMDISDLDPDWQQGIAALHYGAPPADAIQILVEPRLRRAIENHSIDSFKVQASTKGFDRILQKMLDASAPADPFFIANTATLMEALSPGETSWVDSVWRTLRKLYISAKPWESVTKHDVDALRTLLKPGPKVAVTRFAAQTVQRLSGSQETILESAPSATAFVEMVGELVAIAKLNETAAPKVKLPGNAHLYLTAIVAASSSKDLLKALGTDFTDQQLVATLVEQVSSPDLAAGVEVRLRALLQRGIEANWDAFLRSSRKAVQNHGLPAAQSAIYALGHFWETNKIAKSEVLELAQQSILKTRLDEAYSAGQLVMVARTAALLMLSNHPIGQPNGVSWSQALKDHGTLASLINSSLRLFGASATFHHLVERAQQEGDDVAHLSRAIVAIRVRDGNLGGLYVENVIDQLDQYLDLVGPELRDDFLAEFASYPTFWEKLDLAGFDHRVMTPLLSLITKESKHARKGARQKAQEVLKERLLKVKSANWERAVRDNSEPLKVALTFADSRKRGIGLGDELYQALHRMTPELISSDTRDFGPRWFSASKLLAASARRTLLKNLRDQINSGNTIANLVDLLRLGGIDFLDAGEFKQDGDASTRHVILTLLDDPQGLQWLVENAAYLAAWVTESSSDSKAFLTDRMRARWPDMSDQDKSRLEVLAREWGLSAPKP